MRFGLTLATLGVAASASAQLLPSSVLGLSFSPQCQQSLVEVFSNSSLASCLPVATLLPILTSNTSIIPYLDMFMSGLCYSEPCSNATLMTAAQTIMTGCSSDLMGENITTSIVMDAFNTYPIVRETLCLKTADPYSNSSYNSTLGMAPISTMSPVYNSTGGIFCVTSVLTQLSAYFGANLTLPYIESAVTGTNSTAQTLGKDINVLILCNDCIFGAVDIVEEAYPMLGDVPVASVLSYAHIKSTSNGTINSVFNSTCAYDNLAVTMNGTIPANISVSIINSTFPGNVTNGMSTFSMGMMKRALANTFSKKN